MSDIFYDYIFNKEMENYKHLELFVKFKLI